MHPTDTTYGLRQQQADELLKSGLGNRLSARYHRPRPHLTRVGTSRQNPISLKPIGSGFSKKNDLVNIFLTVILGGSQQISVAVRQDLNV